jgi:hypothetical protein
MTGAGRPRRSKLRPRAGQVLSLGLPTAISRLASRRYAVSSFAVSADVMRCLQPRWKPTGFGYLSLRPKRPLPANHSVVEAVVEEGGRPAVLTLMRELDAGGGPRRVA